MRLTLKDMIGIKGVSIREPRLTHGDEAQKGKWEISVMDRRSRITSLTRYADSLPAANAKYDRMVKILNG